LTTPEFEPKNLEPLAQPLYLLSHSDFCPNSYKAEHGQLNVSFAKQLVVCKHPLSLSAAVIITGTADIKDTVARDSSLPHGHTQSNQYSTYFVQRKETVTNGDVFRVHPSRFRQYLLLHFPEVNK
jgi:hypothetical protein